MLGQPNRCENPQTTKPVTVYRATQEKCSSGVEIPEELAKSINFKSTERQNVTRIETAEGVRFCVYSRPAWYVENNHQFKIVDVMVLAETEVKAKAQFEKARAEAEEIRSAATKWVSDNLLPRFKETPQIILVIGRGDIYDTNRLPNYKSDIDVMLFVDFSSLNEGEKAEFKRRLKNTLSAQEDAFFQTTFYNIDEWGYSGDSETLVPQAPGKSVRVGLDLISLPDLTKMITNLERTGRIKGSLNAYAVNTMLHGEILMELAAGSSFKDIRNRISRGYVNEQSIR